MGAFVGVQSCFNKPLIDIAISLGYDEDNIHQIILCNE